MRQQVYIQQHFRRGNAASTQIDALHSKVLEKKTTHWTRLSMPYWYGDERCILEIATGTAIWYHPGMPPAPVRWVLVRDPTEVRDSQAFLCTDLDAAPVEILEWFVSRWSIETTFRKAAHILASRRNGNGPISPSRGRRPRCSGCFRSLRSGRPIPTSPAAFARDRPRGITNANLHSATP